MSGFLEYVVEQDVKTFLAKLNIPPNKFQMKITVAESHDAFHYNWWLEIELFRGPFGREVVHIRRDLRRDGYMCYHHLPELPQQDTFLSEAEVYVWVRRVINSSL